MRRTKDAIIAAFGELLEERPLNKITVKDIVDRCGVNRNTFYYFSDIPSLLEPSLLEETIKEQADEIIQNYSNFDSLVDFLLPMAKLGTEHRRAILHIYRSVQRESFQTALDRIASYIVRRYVEAVTADLLPDTVSNPGVELLIKFYKCALVGSILDWLDSGMKYDVLDETVQICDLFAGSGKQAFLRCIENNHKLSQYNEDV